MPEEKSLRRRIDPYAHELMQKRTVKGEDNRWK